MKPTVLIAENDAETRELFRGYLRQGGFDVETASNGVDCLSKLRRRTPAVLVLDWELSWGGGDGVLAWLRDERPDRATAVILLRDLAWPSEIGRPAGPSSIAESLHKPFKLKALLESVRIAARRSRAAARQADRNRLADRPGPLSPACPLGVR